MTNHTGETDIIYVKDGKEYSAREAVLHALSHGEKYLDAKGADAQEALRRLGYEAREKKKSLLRRFRSWLKAWIRARLIAIGKLERYFA